MVSYLPKYISTRAISLYLLTLVVVSIVFGYPLMWYWWLFGIVEVCGFFFFSNAMSKQWRNSSTKYVERQVFSTSFIIRAVYVIFSFFFFKGMTGAPFEFGAGDALWYDSMARLGSDIIWGADIKWKVFFNGVELSDIGYPLYLTVIYALSGKSILIARLVKALISAYTVVLLFRLAHRNFGEGVAKMTAVFCMLMPNLIYYCGMHLKETEMLFLAVLFIERADALFRTRKIRARDIILLIAIGASTYFFRTVLCAVLFLTIAAAIIFSSKKIKKGLRVTLEIILGLMLLGVMLWSSNTMGMQEYDYSNALEAQSNNMAWRAERNNGNAFASSASSAVFAPLIFTIPFPTLVEVPYQENQKMLNGGNFVKNITSFFTVLALILLLFSGQWKDNILIVAFTCGYLAVLVFSVYAQSERFHIPSLPFELMLAAYGISKLNGKYIKWYNLWLVFIFVANVAWAWFKLRGRGM